MLCQTVKSLGIGALLISGLPFLTSVLSDPPAQPTPSETRSESTGEPARLENDPQQAEHQGRREQETFFFSPAPQQLAWTPDGRWVQKEINFRTPVIVPEGFPLPPPPCPDGHLGWGFSTPPLPPHFPALPPAELPASETDSGSLRVDEQVEIDAAGNRWLVQRKTWTSRGAVSSAMSRIPYTGNSKDR